MRCVCSPYRLRSNICQYETINRLLKKQSRPRAKRAGGPSSTASSVPLAPTGASASDPPQRTSLSKRGNHGRRGRGKLITKQPSSRVPGVRTPGEENGGEGEDGGDAQVEAQGEAMDVDGQAVEAEAEEAEDQVEGEEEDVVESVEGSDLSKAIRGPLAPMFRWVSTSYPVPVASSETKHIVEGREMVGIAKVNMADAGMAQNMEIEPTTATTLSEHDAASAIPAQEKHMRLYFAVPTAFLPLSDQVAPPPLPEPRPPAICAVSGCQDPRKYRLVKDWKIGACGIAHLKVLEGMK